MSTLWTLKIEKVIFNDPEFTVQNCVYKHLYFSDYTACAKFYPGACNFGKWWWQKQLKIPGNMLETAAKVIQLHFQCKINSD